MNILVLESSGNKQGSSNMLAKEFIRGAVEAGHQITEYDVIRKDIRPCLGCGHCGMNGPCARKDDYENELRGLIRAADMLVFVMPVYYYSWPAQLKTVVDRFYSFNDELASMGKKTVLLSVAWDSSEKAFTEVVGFYHRLCGFMGFRDAGVITGRGCGTPEITRSSRYPRDAYELGRRI